MTFVILWVHLLLYGLACDYVIDNERLKDAFFNVGALICYILYNLLAIVGFLTENSILHVIDMVMCMGISGILYITMIEAYENIPTMLKIHHILPT